MHPFFRCFRCYSTRFPDGLYMILLKVLSRNWARNFSIPGTFIMYGPAGTYANLSGLSISGKPGSFLIWEIASIRNLSIPFSSHQMTISSKAFRTSGFSQFKSGFFRKSKHKILTGLFIVFPNRAFKNGLLVIRLFPVFTVPPYIPIPFRIRSCGTGFN